MIILSDQKFPVGMSDIPTVKQYHPTVKVTEHPNIYIGNWQLDEDVPLSEEINYLLSMNLRVAATEIVSPTEENVVLIPDLLEKDRPTYLIHQSLRMEDDVDRIQITDITARAMFTYYHYDDMSGILTAVLRDSPEIYGGDIICVITVKAFSKIFQKELYREYIFYRDGSLRCNTIEDSINRKEGKTFIMYGRRITLSKQAYPNTCQIMFKPKSKFVLGEYNVVILPKDAPMACINKYCNLTESQVPENLSVYWLSDDETFGLYLSALMKWRDSKYLKFLIIGFPYQKALALRGKISELYNVWN